MNRPAATRAGSTLVELLIAIMIGAAMLGVTGTLLARVIHANSAAADHLRGVVALGALGDQFRRDVHATATATVDEADGQPPRLRLTMADGAAVVYEIDPSGLRRMESTAGEPERREAFTLSGMKILGFTADTAASGAISIVIGRLAALPSGEAVSGQFEMTALATARSAHGANPMKQRRSPRAMLLMSVLICLTVAMVLFASWMKTITLEQRHVRTAQDQAQAEYLAASGVARAMAQLAAAPDYAGETWQIDREALALRPRQGRHPRGGGERAAAGAARDRGSQFPGRRRATLASHHRNHARIANLGRVVMNQKNTAGFTLVELLVVIAIIGVLVAMAIPAVQASREMGHRAMCQANLGQILLAVQSYENAFEALPAGVINPDGPIKNEASGLHQGWMIQMLPYLDLQNAYQQIDFQKGVYDPANARVRSLSPLVCICPSEPTDAKGTSNYAGCHHDVEAPIAADNQGVLFLNSHIGRRDISDGASYTIFVGEKRVDCGISVGCPERGPRCATRACG